MFELKTEHSQLLFKTWIKSNLGKRGNNNVLRS